MTRSIVWRPVWAGAGAERRGVLSCDCEEASLAANAAAASRLALAKTCFAVHIGVSRAASSNKGL